VTDQAGALPDGTSLQAAAATAASYQFLDCMPERRVLWRLLYKGQLGCQPPAAAAAAVGTRQQQQQQQQQQHVGTLPYVMPTTPPSVARASGKPGWCCMPSQHSAAVVAAAAGAGPQVLLLLLLSATLPHSHVSVTDRVGAAVVLRRIHQKEHTCAKAVWQAIAVAAQQQQQQQQQEMILMPGMEHSSSSSSRLCRSCCSSCRCLLLHLLLNAAGCVEVCRLHKELHVANWRVSCAHDKAMVEEQADAAAAGEPHR